MRKDESDAFKNGTFSLSYGTTAKKFPSTLFGNTFQSVHSQWQPENGHSPQYVPFCAFEQPAGQYHRVDDAPCWFRVGSAFGQEKLSIKERYTCLEVSDLHGRLREIESKGKNENKAIGP